MYTNITAVVYTSYTFSGETNLSEQMNFKLVYLSGELPIQQR